MSAEELPGSGNKSRSRFLRIAGITAAVLIVAVLLSAWWIQRNLYASPFNPTQLNEKEQLILNAKLEHLERNIHVGRTSPWAGSSETKREGRLKPEPYTEIAAKREISITEKELNALIAQDEEIARRVAIDLSNDMISLNLLIPVETEVPVLGGTTLRLNCGITVGHKDGKPVVAVRGVSIGGVPIPNAWLGNIKNLDLVREFGGQGGFWDVFSEGVEDLRVSDGSFFIKLKE